MILQAEGRPCANYAIKGPGGLTYSWIFPHAGSADSIGELVIRFPASEKSLNLAFSDVPSGDSLHFQKATCTANQNHMTSALTFQIGTHREDLVVTISSQDGSLSVELTGQNALSVNFLTVAKWPSNSEPKPVPVPYYSFPVYWLRGFAFFANSYWDWTASSATILSPNQAEYRALTDGRRNPLHEKLIVKLATDFDEVLPDIPNSKSPYLSAVAGRTVIDIWGPKFSTLATTMAKLQSAGLEGCIALIHVWQRDGYDNGLPEHYPANAALGGDDALSAAVHAGQAAGCLVGLHENYVDYYPDYPGFDPKAVALDAKGEKQKAWLNSGVPIQSFAARPDLYVTIASGQSPEIHRRYHTSASFLDVNSSTFPWWRADLNANAPRAGMFSSYSKASSDLWAFERKSHAGPVFGEGKEHWFWSGQLDGVEAQLGAEEIKSDKPDYPLFLNFDLLKIHPLQVNHGMGYYARWLPSGRTIREAILMDAYRMQEIAFGHAPFIGAELWDKIPQVLVEQDLIGSVAKRYCTASVHSIRYQVNEVWTNTNAAIAANDWSRAEVTYSNGDKIAANTRKEPLVWQGISIPQYGWAAKGADLLAFTAAIGGQIVDYAETAGTYFANARNQKDAEYSGLLAAPKVKQFKQTGRGRAEIQVDWDVLNQADPKTLTNFVHFVGADGKIAFGADHVTSTPTARWSAGETIPDTFPVSIPAGAADGAYSLRVGLYSPSTGGRALLLGHDDGTTRYTLGTLTLAGNGTTLTFEAAAEEPRIADPRLNSSGRLIDFGPLQTDGMVSIKRSGPGWLLRTYPASRNVIVNLDMSVFPPPSSVTCQTGTTTKQSPIVSNGHWSIHTLDSKYCTW